MRLVKASMLLAVATLLTSVASAQTRVPQFGLTNMVVTAGTASPVTFALSSEEAEVLNGIGTSFTVDGITLFADAEGPQFVDGVATGETIPLRYICQWDK